jgi:heparan-alpha-glucosaminide N-acetyltransferase
MEIPAKASRIESVDIVRGITILVMIFVNDIHGIKELPWWTYHIPPDEQGITYVDVVYPAFLMMMGMAIPLAYRARVAMGDSQGRILLHTVIRALSLVAIGILIMNGREIDAEVSGISRAVWNSLMLVGVILFFNKYPKATGKKKNLFAILKWSGLVTVLVLLYFYRRKEGDEIVWIDPKNSSILGGLGFSYLSCGILFLLLRDKMWKLVAALVFLVFLNVGIKAGILEFVRSWPSLLWPFRSGSAASITMCGIIMSMIFLDDKSFTNLHEKFRWGIVFVAALFIGGWLLLPFGLAKIGGTPSWCLLSAGFTGALFIFVYWLVDVKGNRGWAGFLQPAGSNPLLVYLLPDIYYALFRNFHRSIAMEGWIGMWRPIALTALVLIVATILTRRKVRLQL